MLGTGSGFAQAIKEMKQKQKDQAALVLTKAEQQEVAANATPNLGQLSNTPQAQQAAAGNAAYVVPTSSIHPRINEIEQLNFLRNVAGMQEGSQNNFESRYIDYRPFRESLTGQGSQEELRLIQRDQLGRLQDQALGKTPSLADAKLKQAQDRNLAQQLATAQAQRGGNQAALQRNLMRSRAEQLANTNQQGAQLALQERQTAEANLANELGQQRAQDISLQQADLEARRRLASETAQFANKMTLAGQEAKQASKDRTAGMITGIAGAAATLFSSDTNAKENKKPADKDTEKFLDALQASTYTYKDNKNGKGEHLGIMAQALKKSKVGEGMVEETEEGLVVNPGKGFGAMLAAQANINKRLKALESRKKKDKK